MQFPIFIIPLVSWAIMQILKLIIDAIKWEWFSFGRFLVAWGFPSVHSWLSTSLLVTIWYIHGINSDLFAITLIFSILFWYDAANVRYQAGKHAEVINSMRNQLSNIFSLEYSHERNKLKERLWHTFIEVIWWILIATSITIITIYTLKYFWIKFI